MNRISIIGSGNVAWHLGRALKDCGCQIVQVHSKTRAHADRLAQELGAESAALHELVPVDLMLVAISDDKTRDVMELLPENIPVAHTSGRLTLEEVNRNNIAAFYPLQTFSKTRKVDFKTVPICLESDRDDLLKRLHVLAEKLSDSVHIIPGKQKQVLHLAAVFVSNFTNQMYKEGAAVLENSGLDFDLLRPLILEVAQKVGDMTPEAAQTGPAKRKDVETLKTHMEMLREMPESLEIYKVLSERIMKG